MASPAKQAAQKKGGAGGGGGSGWFSAAVAGLESRLDTILADESEASGKPPAKAPPDSGKLAPPAPKEVTSRGSREVSRNRANDRLAERLAKATASKTASQAGSNVPSRVGSPGIADSGRASGEGKRSGDLVRSVLEVERGGEPGEEGADKIEPPKDGDENATLLASTLPINPARVSAESSRLSIEMPPSDPSSTRPSLDLPNGTSYTSKSALELSAELTTLRTENAQTEKQHQEETHTLLEKIDALQAKLSYLAKETVAAAKEANASTSSAGSEAVRLAEKDERIALLMEEGEKLSKTELRHLQTIKKLRAKSSEEEKISAEAKKRLERAEKAEVELKQKLRRAEGAERQASEKVNAIAGIEKQVEELRVDAGEYGGAGEKFDCTAEGREGEGGEGGEGVCC